ncbi:MAG: ribonuclease HIII [Verrucomicrobiota bacterium]|nr:MAG: ribonuclease HIII [Verrucomicrobiota bacterium]
MSIPEKTPTCIVLTLNESQAQQLQAICQKRGFELYAVPYARFAFRAPDFNLVQYQSGKLVLQGKGASEFVTFTIEPQVTLVPLQGNDEAYHPEWFLPHAGLDESGKGDFFGPVVAACVIAGDGAVRAFQAMGVRDSKRITSDKVALALADKIRSTAGVVVEVMSLSMEKYNALYVRFGRNLNRLLGWLHRCALKNALQRRYVATGLLDQFSKQPIVQTMIRKNFPEFHLAMETRAERDPVVAAASIVARAAYLRQMEALSEAVGEPLLKGASSRVKQQGQKIWEHSGTEGLARFCKTHFKTFGEICGAQA